MPPWLPPLIRLSDFDGNWARYEDALYRIFCRDFQDSTILFQGMPLRLKRHPMAGGKEATFWHFTSEGSVEEERTPDLRRCERIGWPRPIIERADDAAVKMWENERGGDRRACLWVEEEDYLVILALRNGYVLPWTAYLVRQDHQKRKLQKEYETFIQSRR
jgi:hypothetical protein